MMKKLLLLSLLLATLINHDLISQSKAEIKNNFYDAESLFLYDSYKDALFIYLQLLKIYPNNSNYKYRIGQCYLNIPGEKKKAISYLEDAVKNINPDYKKGKFRETGAPYDALNYLANAYQINYQLDRALETYETFRKNINSEQYDTTIVNLEMQSCLNAREIMRNPLYVKEKNLGNIINGNNSEFNPVVSDNEDMLVFSRSLPFYDAILYSTKTNGKWSVPLNMNELLNVDRDLFPTSISKDGKTLYLYNSANYDGNIYSSNFENGRWSPIVKLNDKINTKYWESHATISHDNSKLYFTSNRKGTLGGLDIYVSKRDSSGDWGTAVNLGPVINTPYNEESPFLSADDKTLFFSSRGHLNMGGYDIFFSTLRNNGEWSVPSNVGYPINTTDDDLFFKTQNDGYEGYITKDNPGGFGKLDIYRVEMFSNNHPRKFFVRGIVKASDLMNNLRDSVKVSIMNIKNSGQKLVIYSNPETGEFDLNLPQGNYQIKYEGYGSETTVKNFDLPITNPSDSFELPWTMLAKTDFVADLIVESNKNISVTNGDTLLFPLRVEPKSLLTIEHWVEDSPVSVEQYFMNGSTFNYKMAPSPGNNKLVFKLTDRFNNSASTEIFITWEKEISKQPSILPEYNPVTVNKQIAEFIAILKNRADDDLLKVIVDSDIENQQFGNADDILSWLKKEAARKNISSEEVDRLALKVAIMDNILTQAAVDLLAKYTYGDLKKILDDLDIYKAKLKTWTDLQEYISARTGGKISPEALNKIAADILSGIDPSISILREKILAFSENYKEENLVRQSVATTDLGNIKLKEKWLLTFINESGKQGLTLDQISEMLVMISSLPDTKVEQYLRDLIEQTEEPLLSSLKSIDLKKEKIKSPKDLIMFLLTNKEKYPEEAVSKSIANLIIAKDIPAGIITSQHTTVKDYKLWILLIVAGASFLFFFIISRKKRKKNSK
ncbi:MAG: hypothetical protein WCS03_06640 [Bacteroidota bacterium]